MKLLPHSPFLTLEPLFLTLARETNLELGDRVHLPSIYLSIRLLTLCPKIIVHPRQKEGKHTSHYIRTWSIHFEMVIT